MVYADYAATSGKVPSCVIDAVVNAMMHPGNAGRGAHEQSLSAQRILLEARMEIAKFFDVPDFSKVVFTSGVTESLNTVIKGILTSKDHAITTWAEHNSVLRPLYELQEKGMALSITNPNLESIQKQIREDTKMVVMTHGSNVTGEVYNIEAVGRLCREKKILFVVDVAQTAGNRRISMTAGNIDVLCFTGHKGLMGPQGTGGICIRENIEIRPLKSGGTGMDSFSKKNPKHFPEALEVGTMNIPGIAGLLAGVQNIQKLNLKEIQEKEKFFARRFFEGVRNLEEIKVYGQIEDFEKRTAIVSLNMGEYSSAEVSDELEQRFGIMTRSGAHCAPLVHEHFKTKNQGMVRFSFGYDNTEEEVDLCIQALSILIEEEKLEERI